MILKCDQCNTNFKLDDAKIKEGGVKVRCSKCKHVFLVTKDTQDEADFDSILDGLNAQESVPPEAAAQAKTIGANGDGDSQAPPVGFAQLRNALEASAKEENGTAAQPVAAENALDFSSFNFDDSEEEPAKAEAETEAKSYDLSDFNLDDEDGSAVDSQMETGVDAAFAEPPRQEESRFQMNEFSFDDSEPEPEPVATAGDLPEPFGHNDFSFKEDAPVHQPSGADPTPPGEFDFNDFSFDSGESQEEQASMADAGSAVPGAGLDFDSFDFESAEEPSKEQAVLVEESDSSDTTTKPLSKNEMELDLPEPGPGEQFSALSSTPATADADAPGEFSFERSESESDTVAPPIGLGATEHSGDAEMPEFSFGDLPEQTPNEQEFEKVAADDLPAEVMVGRGGNIDLSAIDFGEVAPPVVPSEEDKTVPLLNNLVGGEQRQEIPPAIVSEADFQDEYPPLSISSRRKNSSFLTFAGVGAFILVLVLAGGGLFLIKSRPEVFNRMGLGAIAQGLGVKSTEEGRITVKNPVGSFIVNKEAGELFIITGQAVNEYKKPRASIQVKASLFGKDGKPVMQKVVYCGNNLSREQLVSMPLDKLETAMNNQFGDSLSNLGLQPGKEIPFVVVLNKVPQDISEFGVEVTGSTVAGQ